jgi:membrane protease YdiL (CAAX protease family)
MSEVVPFRDAQWKTRWVIVGITAILMWRCVALLDREWLARVPWWALLLFTGLVPQVFLLVYPILTREPRRLRTFGLPGPRRFLIELGIAIPVVIVTILALAVANYTIGRISPGTSLTPDAITNMAASPDRTLTYLLLGFAVLFAPLAEEVFFRGFLQNAFRARLPWLVATVAQCLIFGLGHFFGLMHSGMAFVLGLMLTLHYRWRKVLIAPILVHAGLNGMSTVGVAVMMHENSNSAALGVVGDPNDTVCVVREVVPASAAEQAGLKVGDIIVELSGEPIRGFDHLGETVRRYQPGDKVTLTVKRNVSSLEMTAVLQRRG